MNNEQVLEKVMHPGTKCSTTWCTENFGRWTDLAVCDLVFGYLSMIKKIPWPLLGAVVVFVVMAVIGNIFGK